MRIFFSVGEPSGDLHGANLIRELAKLDKRIECVGFGGPKMAEAGCHLNYDLTQLAVMWFWNVLTNIRFFFRLLAEADDYMAKNQVDAVVLIDYPGFNWWVARKAKARGIPVFYYGAPQMWAWAGWRIKKMRTLIDYVLCKLPFEAKWYSERGCKATYVGHPFFDEVERQQIDREFIAREFDMHNQVVGLLPGSRRQEVARNFENLVEAARKISFERPDTEFAVACFNEKQKQMCEEHLKRVEQVPNLRLFVGRTPEVMTAATCCIACSGSVSLELMARGKPTVIVYRIGLLGWLGQSIFRTCEYITLVNLLWADKIDRVSRGTFDPDAPTAAHVPFPEYLTTSDCSSKVANHVINWLSDDSVLSERKEQLQVLMSRFGQTGASRRGAEFIYSTLQEKSGRKSVNRAA